MSNISKEADLIDDLNANLPIISKEANPIEWAFINAYELIFGDPKSLFQNKIFSKCRFQGLVTNDDPEIGHILVFGTIDANFE